MTTRLRCLVLVVPEGHAAAAQEVAGASRDREPRAASSAPRAARVTFSRL